MNDAPMIYVDADACPVKAEVLKIADRARIAVTLVANGGLRPSRDPMVRHVVVGAGADVADDWIVAHVAAGDIVITADIPLAGRALEKGAAVIGPSGRSFTEASIGMALAMRDLKRDLREAGAINDHHAAFSPQDRARFTQALADAVQRAKRR